MPAATRARSVMMLLVVAALTACSGGSSPTASGSGSATVTPTPTPTSAPTPTPSACTLRSRQDWAAAQLREWYLFPETLPAALDPSGFSSVQAYVDALTATARGQGRDRFFTFITSIAEEEAFFASGQTAAFGVRTEIDNAARRMFIVDAYEGAPALAAGIDRGAEILAIGTNAANLRSVSAIIAAEGSGGITNALGPSTAGTTRTLELRSAGGTRLVTITKADFAIPPISPRFGTRVLTDNGQRIGYINLRTFITPAGPALRDSFARLRAEGVTHVIIDFRYNGGGLVTVAEEMGDLLADNRLTTEVLSFTSFRPEKSQLNETRRFRKAPEAIASSRIAFIGTRSSASASEAVMNGSIPYLGAAAGLIGANTFGKPVGQIGLDRAQCDDRLRVVAFSVQNANRQANYFNGMASEFAATCQAGDSIERQMGDPEEASTRAALDFLVGRPCTPISTDPRGASVREGQRQLLIPQTPTVAQREVPGTF